MKFFFNLFSFFGRQLEKYKLKLSQKLFSNIEDAINYCEKKNKGSYNNIELSKYSYNKFLENIDNFKISFNYSHKFLLEILLIYKNKYNYLPKILDVGGVYGENKIFLDHLFGNNEIIYDIMEVPSKVIFAKNLKHSKFFDNLSIALKNDYDVIFSSSTLQYFRNPYETLELILRSKKKYIGFTRMNFHPHKELYIAQPSRIIHNGPGEGWINKNYSNNKFIYYYNTAISIIKFKEMVINNNYKIERETQGLEGNIGPDTFTKNFLIKKMT